MSSIDQVKAQEKACIKGLKAQLSALQQPLREAGIPVIVLLEGLSASGKGDMIGELISELDPRGYTVYTTDSPSSEDSRLPFLAPFWRKLPKRGEMAIFDRGWYSQMLSLPKKQQTDTLASVRLFERQLADDGYLILKYFLHIGKKEQADRLETLERDYATAWRVTRKAWSQNKNHEKYCARVESLMSLSDAPYAPWHLVKNKSPRNGTIQVLQTLVTALNTALSQGVSPTEHGPQRICPLCTMPRLAQVPLDVTLPDGTYKEQLKAERKAIQHLHGLLYREKVPMILAFEGWDAAGKGGAIRRLSWALDPRGFDVIPIAAPTQEDLAHHYLWRFWNQVPKDGHIAIFDRSWYGRVMVEQVEGFTSEARCQQAYQEINEFETELTNWGAIVIKFWIQINQDEQLQRFTDRQNTPEKQYKLTDEDWRNREKWNQYEVAVDEMLQHTSTQNAPWIIVEGNDKHYARLKILRTVRTALEKRLLK